MIRFFPALVAGDAVLLKPFLDLSFECLQREITSLGDVFQTYESPRGPSWGCTVGGEHVPTTRF
jgi:hypothetical protein